MSFPANQATDVQTGSPSAGPHGEYLYLIGFVAVNLAIKLALLHFNGGSYTDGIIQLQTSIRAHQPVAKLGLYPPLYGQLSQWLALTGLSLEIAGRTVSAVAGSVAVLPVFCLARLLFGRDAARISALLFTVSPLVIRWSTHVQTDSLFLALSGASVYYIVKAWQLARESASSNRMGRSLAFASALAALATYTRYQGALLVLPLVMATAAVMRRRCFPVSALIASALWIAPAEFLLTKGGVHAGQLASRTAGSLIPTLAAYWNTFESLLLIAPYYFGYPIAALAITGLFLATRRSRGVLPFGWVFGTFGVALLVLHAAFGSFQYRYMMPLLPGVVALSGHGAHQLYLAAQARRLYPIYSAAMLLSLCYLTIFSTAVLVFQRQTLSDQKQAAIFVKQHAAPGEAVFANERYGDFTHLGCIKLSFWSGRKVEMLYDPETGRLRDLPPGSWVILGNEYGGNQPVEAFAQELQSRYITESGAPPFSASIIPLMDDIMVDPLFNQNPMGWVLRYTPQTFFTRVIRIAGKKL